MAVQINTYTGLKSAVLAWLSRDTDTRLDARFDDFLLMAERRMYYGHATEDMGNPLRSDPVRVPEMETVDSAFTLDTTGTVAQPTDFLELVSVYNSNGTPAPMAIVAENVLDGYATGALGGTEAIAVSGTNFRYKDVPSTSQTVTLRYYKKLTTPTASAANDILTNYPDVYLYACLTEAAIFTQGVEEATRYMSLYNASVAGLNARRQRLTASAAPKMRLRGVSTP